MRRRNAAETRGDILEAARHAFSSKGFDQVGVREITGAIGVNGSLVNRYFGTKEKLFAEVMQAGFGLADLGEHNLDEVLEWLTDRALDRSSTWERFDPVLALIRSAPIEKAQPVLRDYIAREAVAPLANLIGGEGADERASLIFALVIGVIILRTVIKTDPLASTRRNDLALMIDQIVRSAATHPAPIDEHVCDWPRST